MISYVKLIAAKEESESVSEELMAATALANDMATQAEIASISKSQFLANMSHEIRTPMNGIVGFADILSEDDLTSDQKRYVEIIRSSGQSLLKLINDILDFSKIEAGKLDIENVDCTLMEILESVEPMMRSKAAETKIDFEIISLTSLPSRIHVDSTRLRQCLINLANNALKFTEEGHVRVNISLEEDGSDSFLRFDIEDTGIGITPKQQKTIFHAFVQADGSTTRKYGGTGLGLSITKRLSELMGGSLSLTSQAGKGSVFSLLIPTGVDVSAVERLASLDFSGLSEPSSDTGEDAFLSTPEVDEPSPDAPAETPGSGFTPKASVSGKRCHFGGGRFQNQSDADSGVSGEMRL